MTDWTAREPGAAHFVNEIGNPVCGADLSSHSHGLGNQDILNREIEICLACADVVIRAAHSMPYLSERIRSIPT